MVRFIGSEHVIGYTEEDLPRKISHMMLFSMW